MIDVVKLRRFFWHIGCWTTEYCSGSSIEQGSGRDDL